MIKCKDVEALWAAHCDGDLSPEMGLAVDAHLKGCASCRNMARSFERLEFALDAIGDHKAEAPAFLATRIMARIEEEREPLIARILKHFTAPRLIAASLVAIAFFGGVATREMLLKSPLGESLATQKVVFEFDAPAGAGKVGLVGDFNDWGLKNVPISVANADGKWTFEVKLEPGRYQYAFVVDGKKWLPDPKAASIIPDGFGGKNSLLYVQGGLNKARL
ncbi:hypothetical protein FDZ71_09735 [bacterium]|nr:MAG: hypothetical protein FDZ71_09735 [bacterium]